MNQEEKLIQKTVIVLGMHRSGTSIVAGILKILGVNMGKELMEPNWANPLGYFENKKFVRLNDEILAAAGGSWKNPPSQEKILKLRNKFSQRIISLINQEKSQIWGWKDPRTTLTIEMYLPYLENPYFIICRRKTKDIAQSLKRRDKIKIRSALNLDRIYQEKIKSFLEKHPDLPKIVLSFEEIIKNPIKEAEKIANFLGLNLNEKKIEKIREFVKPRYKMKIIKIIARLRSGANFLRRHLKVKN